MPAISSLTRGYTVAFISAVFLSTTAIFIRHLTQTYHIPALVLAFWRTVFVTLTLICAMGIIRPSLLRVPRTHIVYLFLYGALLAVFNSLWTLSVSLNGASIATVLAYSSAAFTALLGWWLLKERLDWAKLLAVTLSLSGCVLVSGAADPAAWNANLLGILTGLLSGLGYAGYSLMGRSASQRGMNPWSTLLYTFGFGMLFLLIFNITLGKIIPGAAKSPSEIFWLSDSWAGWGWLILLAAGPTVAGFGLYNVSMVDLPSSIANLIATSEPVFTAIIAYLILGERLTRIQIIGGALIMLGVFFLRIYNGWRKNFKTSPKVPAE